jgi:uncharacterized membrane protein
MPSSKKEMTESRKRSLVKTIIYRALIVLFDFAVLYIFTKKIILATGVVLVTNIYPALLYYFYERFWNKVQWGIGPSKNKNKNKK